MKNSEVCLAERVLKITAWTVSVTAVVQLALSQFTIRISRLSTAEQTGIALFAFMILGLIAIFAVSRMKDGFGAKLFAVLVNFLTATAAVWYLSMLFTDDIFLRGLYYTMDHRTQALVPMSPGERIAASLPIVTVILGAAVYCLASIAIIGAGLARSLKNRKNGRLANGD